MVARDLYGHLGCPRGAGVATVLKCAKLTKFELHPDKHPHASRETLEKLKRSWECMEKTIEILGNKERRKIYNQLLREKRLGKHGGIKTDFKEINEMIDEFLYRQ